MSFFDSLMGMYDQFWCPQCVTYLSNCPHGQPERPGRVGRVPKHKLPSRHLEPIKEWLEPTDIPIHRQPVHRPQPLPPGWQIGIPQPIHRIPGHRPPILRTLSHGFGPVYEDPSLNLYEDLDEDGWQKFPEELMKPENWGLPPKRHPSPAYESSPKSSRPKPKRSQSGTPKKTKPGLVIDDRKEPSGGITDHRAIEVPQLLPPDPAGRIKPRNHNESFLNPCMLRGVKAHPYVAGYPQTLQGDPPPLTSLTPEQASARAFVLFMVSSPWTQIGEDMYTLLLEQKLPKKLIKHLKYFFGVVLPHMIDGGEVPPGDYCKIRALIDWMAEVGNCFGSPMVWGDSFGKGGGKARESGWWRMERDGFPEGPGGGLIRKERGKKKRRREVESGSNCAEIADD